MQNFIFSKTMISNMLKVKTRDMVKSTSIVFFISKSFLKMPLGVGIIGKNLNSNASNDSDVILEREIDAVNVQTSLFMYYM